MRKLSILMRHPEYRSYRAILFEELNKKYQLKFIFMKGTNTIPKTLSSISLNSAKRNIQLNLKALLLFLREVLFSDYDIFLTSNLNPYSFIGATLAKARRKKVMLWTLDWYYPRKTLRRRFSICFGNSYSFGMLIHFLFSIRQFWYMRFKSLIIDCVAFTRPI